MKKEGEGVVELAAGSELRDQFAESLIHAVLHRADFYREHKRPKKLWLKTLSRNTRVILTGMDLPAAYQPGRDLQTAERALPLKKAHLESLRDVLREVPEPRAGNSSPSKPATPPTFPGPRSSNFPP